MQTQLSLDCLGWMCSQTSLTLSLSPYLSTFPTAEGSRSRSEPTARGLYGRLDPLPSHLLKALVVAQIQPLSYAEGSRSRSDPNLPK